MFLFWCFVAFIETANDSEFIAVNILWESVTDSSDSFILGM